MSKSDQMIGEKQVCSNQGVPEEPIETEYRIELQNDTIVKENQVVTSSGNDLGSLDNQMDKTAPTSNMILDGMSSDGVDVSLRCEHVSADQGEGAHVSVTCEQSGLEEKVDSEAGPDIVNVEQKEKSKDDPINSSCVEAEQIFLVEPMKMLHNDISKNCGVIEENERGDSSLMGRAEIPLVEQVEILQGDLLKNCGKFRDSSEMEGAELSPVRHVEILHRDQPKVCGKNEGSECGDASMIEGVEISPAEQVELLHCGLPNNCGKIEGNECSDSSVMEGVEISPVEQVEMLHSDLANKCGKIEGNECGDSSMMEGVEISLVEKVELLHSDLPNNCGKIEGNECGGSSQMEGVQISPVEEKYEIGACDAKADPIEQSTTPPTEIRDEKLRVVVLALPATDGSEKPRRGRKPGKTAAILMKEKNSQRSSIASTRALRSRSKENSKDPEPSVDLETAKGSTGRRGRKKGKEKDEKSGDEFSRMRKHLRYLLHRIKYEQNLLDAYSSEGWRGQSIEKLRPEKELQRAKADINRSKLKIRDLFQRLDSISAEGKFPESLYDSDGLIDSEDIFCAKCASKDLSIGNDILLCDGICERGFHQNCLDPPLRTEEIPPGDEGWLCPACDCKADCIDLLNDSHGMKLAIEDTWEKIFPEAVATTDAKELDDIMGLPSDDSEDNEYNPDGIDGDVNAEGDESSSDESNPDDSDSSDFSSVSEDLAAVHGAEQNLGLPSDDSEDDDFDPDAVNVDEVGIEHESSTSDFTSASEDLAAAVDNEGTSYKDEPSPPLELEQDFAESSPVTGKRSVERLDYKKLYDETYGIAASDSSDDEEWTDIVATRKRKSKAEKSISAPVDGTCSSGTPRRRGRPRANCQVANGSPGQLQDGSLKTGSAGSSKKRPPYNRLGEAVTKRLYESFKENQYPDRETKEKLANELGLTALKVDKWFGNARWSFNHHPSRVEASMSRAVSGSNPSLSVACNGDGNALADGSAVVPECGNADTSTLDATSTKKSASRKSRKNPEGDRSMLKTSEADKSKESTQTVDPLQEPEIPLGRLQRKRRKSGA